MTTRVLSRFRRLSDVWLALRVGAWACVLPVAKRVVPIRSLVRLMYRPPVRRDRDAGLEDQIVTFARWGARIVRWRDGGNCLERGLIAYRYLARAGARPTLMVGVERIASGVRGHAWVLVDGEPAGETRAAVAAYTPVFAFGPDGTLLDTPVGRPPAGVVPDRLYAARG